jgi:hypothetical protein
MIITIHQPEHLIWLGLVDKISKADTFVILDNVQFTKNNVQNRNKIRTSKDWTWLTVPVKKHSLSTLIKDIEIANESDWRGRHLELIRSNYAKSDHFSGYYPELEKIILSDYQFLSKLNIGLINFFLKSFEIQPQIVLASDMDLPENNVKGGIVLEICKLLKADTYISGAGGKHYLDVSLFEKDNIKVIFQEFEHPVYKQQYEPFIPFMSSIDLLFNYGPDSKKILLKR